MEIPKFAGDGAEQDARGLNLNPEVYQEIEIVLKLRVFKSMSFSELQTIQDSCWQRGLFISNYKQKKTNNDVIFGFGFWHRHKHECHYF